MAPQLQNVHSLRGGAGGTMRMYVTIFVFRRETGRAAPPPPTLVYNQVWGKL